MLSSASRLALDGIAIATSDATSATAAPISSPVLKPFSLVTWVPPRSMVIWASTTPTTAAAIDVPTERLRVLKLLADAVSETGTDP